MFKLIEDVRSQYVEGLINKTYALALLANHVNTENIKNANYLTAQNADGKRAILALSKIKRAIISSARG